MKYILLLLIFSYFSLAAQEEKEECCRLDWSTALPTVSANHPLGIFITQSQANFGAKQNKHGFNVEYSMGNVWLPEVSAYYPTNDADRAEIERYVWHFRGHKNLQNPDSISFQADGVLRTYLFSYDIPFKEGHRLSVNAKVYSLDGGKLPFSTISSDRFIEWFHSNIAGGEDPFARKDYAYDKALIRYRDKDGNQLLLKNGAVGLASIAFNYQYQLSSAWLNSHAVQLQANAVLGLNFNSFNRSLDFGVGVQGMKDFRIFKRSLFRIGASGEATHINSFNSNTKVAITDVSWISQFSFFMGWEKALKNQNSLSISTLHQIKTSYLNPEAKDYYALDGDSDVSHWHYAMSHLYNNTFGNSLIVAYRRKAISYNVYLRQDLLIADNAPDIQTGIGVHFQW